MTPIRLLAAVAVTAFIAGPALAQAPATAPQDDLPQPL